MATVKTNTDVFEKAWEGFKGTDWKEKASVSRFVQANYTPYDGDESFLAGPTERSLHIKKIVEETKAHYEAIAEHGVIDQHRRSYGPVKKALGID